ncbi:MAG: hypothetical protein GX549_08070 [Clostridiales bacterium]|nr:hypothetical protein [Clostridiales bacterium]
MLPGVFNQVQVIRNGLDKAWVNHQVIANNIANAETPGYTAQRIEARASGEGVKEGSTRWEYEIAMSADPADANGNNVNMEKEMAELAKNSLAYNALVRKIAMELRQIEAAINEGR